MTETKTSAEMDTVVSSVRRLVSGPKQPVRQPTQDRLVLTPQLRVSSQEVLVLTAEDAVSDPRPKQDFEASVRPEVIGASGSRPDRQATATARRRQMMQSPDISELISKIAALEMAIATTADQWEPDGPGRDAYAGTAAPAMVWQDQIDLDATGKPVSDAPISSSEMPEAQDPSSGGIVETELQAMVSQMVRAELHGELGERMTRMIRKLVRHEIRQALAAQSLRTRRK